MTFLTLAGLLWHLYKKYENTSVEIKSIPKVSVSHSKIFTCIVLSSENYEVVRLFESATEKCVPPGFSPINALSRLACYSYLTLLGISYCLTYLAFSWSLLTKTGQMLTIDEEDDECDYLTDVFERQRKSGVDDDHESDELYTPKDESQKEEPRKGDK